MFAIQSEMGKEGSFRNGQKTRRIAQKRRNPPDNLTATNLILTVGVPQREQDTHALEERNELSKQLAFCRVLL